jgi:hypothetical protein
MLVLNLATCVPVWLAVGIFSIYHVYCAVGNSTTIEGWEKDRVATLVRRGKIRHMKYPYVSCIAGEVLFCLPSMGKSDCPFFFETIIRISASLKIYNQYWDQILYSGYGHNQCEEMG